MTTHIHNGLNFSSEKRSGESSDSSPVKMTTRCGRGSILSEKAVVPAGNAVHGQGDETPQKRGGARSQYFGALHIFTFFFFLGLSEQR